MSNELMVILPEAQQNAWLSMAVAKNDLVAELTQAELQAQGLILNIPEEHAQIDAALAAYRKAHADMVELRKGFTNQVDKGIIQPLMAFEKRVDPKSNETYRQLEATSLTLRQTAAQEAQRSNQINQELASFKAHCTNEFFRVAAEYRSIIRKEITSQYEFWLNEKKAPTIEQLRKHLSVIPVPSAAKFKPVLITKEQMADTFNSIHKPDYAAIFEEMMISAEQTFANFESDVANSEAALAEVKEAEALAAIQANQQLAEDTAINTLIATSEAVVVNTPTIKHTYTITIIESEAWAKTIMAGFISNLPALGKYIRVKSWSKLSIGQMAEYLAKLATDTDTKIKGVDYASVER